MGLFKNNSNYSLLFVLNALSRFISWNQILHLSCNTYPTLLHSSPYPILSYPTLSYSILFYPTLSYPILSPPVSYHNLSYSVTLLPCYTLPYTI